MKAISIWSSCAWASASSRLDELFETLTWGQLGIMYKPVGLLNINGYYDHVVQWVEMAVGEGFVRPHHRNLFVVGNTPAELLDQMAAMPTAVDILIPAR